MVRPGMSDGRSFTDYSPSCSMNNKLKETFKLNTNNDYRQYLQNNADKIIKNNLKNPQTTY